VRASFVRARYDSALNAKPWNTFYFFLQGRPVRENLAACPFTAAVLREIPHNGFHVCFSAIAPGGGLHPHTGPTNASLTAHLGLTDCAGARLWVAGESAEYRDGDVLVFDDSFVHCVDHDGGGLRCTLMITFWHPELTALERAFFRRVVQSTAT
jgi:aspartyl/asparaginyl beta-hydroxylase (cupin superfamily)